MKPCYCAGSKRDGGRCGQRLFDVDEDALRPGKQLRLKCHKCNHMNVFDGPRVEEPAAAR